MLMTLAQMESDTMRLFGVSFDLSPQQITSCEIRSCRSGSNMPTVFEYIMINGGLTTEDTYPYLSGGTGLRGLCFGIATNQLVNTHHFSLLITHYSLLIPTNQLVNTHH